MEKNGIIFLSKKLSSVFKRITLKNNGDFYCLNCLRAFRKENENIKIYVKIMIIVM